jgi:hypothetical protein
LIQLADAVGVIGLVGQHDGASTKTVEQRVGDLPDMRLPGRQVEAVWEPPRIESCRPAVRE